MINLQSNSKIFSLNLNYHSDLSLKKTSRQDKLKSMKIEKKFVMIQDHILKYKKLKNNLAQSQTYGQDLKSQILSLGSLSNSLLISVSQLTTQIAELKSQIPKKEKQLLLAKEQLKKIQYKASKVQIKQKEYEQRARRFNEMLKVKKEKNLTLIVKIQSLSQKLKQEKQKSTLYQQELKNLQSSSQDQYISTSFRSNSKKNTFDEIQLQILGFQSKIKNLNQEKEDLDRKNSQLKSNINKIQLKANQIASFLAEKSSIPDFKELNTQQLQKQNALLNIMAENDKDTIAYSRNNKLPSNIVPALSSFRHLKSQSIIQNLLQKHRQATKLEQNYLQAFSEGFGLLSQLSKVNSILETQLVQQNNKISTLSIKGKKFTEKNVKFSK